jgi:hypothetical protein
MAKINTAVELAEACKRVAKNYKTLYVMGCFGAPMTASNKKRYTKNHPYNEKPIRTKMIMDASADTFGFDCVGLIKGLLWGWDGDANRVYGGATYCSNGVPDIGADTMIAHCVDVTNDFSRIEVGEAVWTTGHIGIYVGDGLAVECTPSWADKVQITACNCSKSGYKRRNWKKHGKLPYVKYVGIRPPLVDTMCKLEVPELHFGARSGYVKTVQTLLNKYDNAKLAEDGYFGNGTKNAVVAYQKKRGLATDGVVGKQTWAQLLK